MFSRALSLLMLICFGAASAGSQGPVAAHTVIAGEGLQKDVAVLRSAFEQLHPGLYRYKTKPEMNHEFAELQKDLGKDQPLEQVYLRLAEFTATIECGHTFANPYNQSKAVAAALFEGRGRLPFFYRWIAGNMVVTRDWSANHSLPPGTQVLAIDGMEGGVLLHRLMKLASADGANDARRINLSERQGQELYENADLFLPMIVPRWSGNLRLRVRKPGAGHTSVMTVTKQTDAEANAAFAASQPDGNGAAPLFTVQYLDSGVAVLTMPTWVMFHTKWDWKGWLNRTLDEITERKAPALIVDLRGNVGGDSVGDLILARLRSGPARALEFSRLMRYRRVPQELLPYLSTYDPTFKDWGSRAVGMPAPLPTAPPVPYYRQVQEPDGTAAVDGTARHFAGHVFVLTDASNSSATFAFARAVQQEQLGLLVGGGTGGNQRGINGGAFFFLKLPNSGIEIDLPLIGYFPAGQQPNAGLAADVAVSTTRLDVESGIDRVLLRAIELAARP